MLNRLAMTLSGASGGDLVWYATTATVISTCPGLVLGEEEIE